ncbi:MAG: hypothetical protein ACE5OR_14970 [bacterium]
MAETISFKIEPRTREKFIKKCRDLKVSSDEILESLVKAFVKDKDIDQHSLFAEGLTVKEYLSLSDQARQELWDKWYQQAEREVGDIVKNVKANAISS